MLTQIYIQCPHFRSWFCRCWRRLRPDQLQRLSGTDTPRENRRTTTNTRALDNCRLPSFAASYVRCARRVTRKQVVVLRAQVLNMSR